MEASVDERWSSKEFILANRAKQKRRQRSAYVLMYIAAALAVVVLLIIIGFIFVKGFSALSWEFLSEDVSEAGASGGIFPLILNTLYLVGLGMLFAAPLSVLAAIYMTEYARQGVVIKVIRFFTTNLAGIPSIIFGLFGFMFFGKILGWSFSLLNGAATVAIVILPTLIRTAEEAIITVPSGYKEGSLALGATKWKTMYKIVIPAASPGIINGIILGMGRIFGETAALYFTVGSSTKLATGLMSSARTLAIHLYYLAKEGASSNAVERAYGTATVLIVVILILNLIAGWFGKRINRYKEMR